ncbi:MAG: F0F1 ATP synthase subunit delta, partial [Oscillospiraceae bacterium]|nr:F0F1 ATP synthase subunit delta [Oscillospiraceae bacterium]
MDEQEMLHAVLSSATPPTAEQKSRFEAFLSKRHGCPVTLEWVADEALEKGCRFQVGTDQYDWTREGLMRPLQERLDK